MTLHKHQLYLLEQHSKGKSSIMNLAPGYTGIIGLVVLESKYN